MMIMTHSLCSTSFCWKCLGDDVLKRFLSVIFAIFFFASTYVVAFATSYPVSSLPISAWPRYAVKTDDGHRIYFSYDDVSDSALDILSKYYPKYFAALSDPSKKVFYYQDTRNADWIAIFVLESPVFRYNVLSSGRHQFFFSTSDGFFLTLGYTRVSNGVVKMDKATVTTFENNGRELYYSASFHYVWNGVTFSYQSELSSVTGLTNFQLIETSGKDPSVSSHTLTVNYLYANEQPAAEAVTQTIAAGETYSIQSPEIMGYTPSIQVVSGTMPEEDLTVNVYYAKAFYDLTVKYQHQDGTEAAPKVAFQYPAGFVYDIPSPTVSGYQPDKPSVYGEMPGEAVTETVTYSPIPYTLTVNYRFADGTAAAETHRQQLHKGERYSVPSPEIPGYHPNQSAVTGVMPAEDVTATVTYREDSGGSGGPGPAGPGEGGGSGGDGGDSSGGSSGDDLFIPVLPPSPDYDPFLVPQPPPYSGPDPFLVPEPPPYSGHDPFIVRQPPPWSGYDPFAIPDDFGG